MRFEFAMATRIIFGAGVLPEVGPLAAGLGSRALLVTGKTPARAQPLLGLLAAQGLPVETFTVTGEPTTETVRQGMCRARETGCDLVIGMGGGSVLDAAQAIAMLLANGGDPLDYLEVIGHSQPITRPSVPYIAIPTTAGTGTEVTRNAVLKSPEHRVKVSLRSALMLPRVAVVDPVLTYTMTPAVTASTGLDAFTQVMEPFVSDKANPLVDAVCRDGLMRAARSLRRAYASGDPAAREDMALVSLYGGLALANAGLGAVHGFAGPLGGMFPAPHGAVCARLLPFVMAANVQALAARGPDHPALDRYNTIAQIVTSHPDATAAEGVAWVEALVADLDVPPLSAYGMTGDDIPEVAEKASQSSSMRGNPILLTPDEMAAILQKAL